MGHDPRRSCCRSVAAASSAARCSALGRALGETIAVLLIISPAFDIKINILSVGTETTSALIAGLFGEATSAQLSALLTAGFVLFLMTLGVNTIAAVFVSRSRSGAATEI